MDKPQSFWNNELWMKKSRALVMYFKKTNHLGSSDKTTMYPI